MRPGMNGSHRFSLRESWPMPERARLVANRPPDLSQIYWPHMCPDFGAFLCFVPNPPTQQ